MARQALCVDFLAPRWAAVADRHAAWLQVLHQAWQRGARQALASTLDWTPRHLQRRTRQLTGLRPGEIERMLRAEHALLAMRDGNAGALDAALRHGYADQAHFSREARALFERPPPHSRPTPSGRATMRTGCCGAVKPPAVYRWITRGRLILACSCRMP